MSKRKEVPIEVGECLAPGQAESIQEQGFGDLLRKNPRDLSGIQKAGLRERLRPTRGEAGHINGLLGAMVAAGMVLGAWAVANASEGESGSVDMSSVVSGLELQLALNDGHVLDVGALPVDPARCEPIFPAPGVGCKYEDIAFDPTQSCGGEGEPACANHVGKCSEHGCWVNNWRPDGQWPAGENPDVVGWRYNQNDGLFYPEPRPEGAR